MFYVVSGSKELIIKHSFTLTIDPALSPKSRGSWESN